MRMYHIWYKDRNHNRPCRASAGRATPRSAKLDSEGLLVRRPDAAIDDRRALEDEEARAAGYWSAYPPSLIDRRLGVQ